MISCFAFCFPLIRRLNHCTLYEPVNHWGRIVHGYNVLEKGKTEKENGKQGERRRKNAGRRQRRIKMRDANERVAEAETDNEDPYTTLNKKFK